MRWPHGGGVRAPQGRGAGCCIVTHGGLATRLEGYISVLFHLVRKSVSFQWGTSRRFPFLQQIMGGMGRKGNGGRGGGRGASIFKPLPGISSVEVSVRKEEGKRRGEGAGDS